MTLSLLSSSDPAILSNLLPFLEHLHAPNPLLSQNFLVDKNIIEKILRAARLSQSDQVCEIGSGPGALTKALVDLGLPILAIEKDPSFANQLQRFDSRARLLHVLESDFLEVNLEEYYSSLSPCKILGNLPYHLTKPILRRLCSFSHVIQSATVMVQREVADKLVQSKTSSAFQLELQLNGRIYKAFDVSRSCFYPAPAVQSSILHIDFACNSVENLQGILSMAKMCFQQKRKQLKSSLRPRFSEQHIVLSLKEINKSATCRPEDLTTADWSTLFNLLHQA